MRDSLILLVAAYFFLVSYAFYSYKRLQLKHPAEVVTRNLLGIIGVLLISRSINLISRALPQHSVWLDQPMIRVGLLVGVGICLYYLASILVRILIKMFDKQASPPQEDDNRKK